MKVVFKIMRVADKSKLLIEFDRAIKDAEAEGSEILCFKLESKEENEMFSKFIDATAHGWYVPGGEYTYEGVEVQEFKNAS